MWDTYGYDRALEPLALAAAAGRLSHAYLITGPAHVGKTTVALDLARTINCLGDEPPCGKCLSCRKIAHGTHPDVKMVEPALRPQSGGGGDEEDESGGSATGGTVGIGQIRALQHEASLSPYEGRVRVYILAEFERASTEASNSLLKTLEEPPEKVLLVLTSQSPGNLLPTIRSRCQVLRLHPLPAARVKEALMARWDVEAERAGLLASLSMGRLGWAVQAQRNERLIERRRAGLEHLLSALDEGRYERMDRAFRLSQRTGELTETLEQWFVWWRDVLLIGSGCAAHLLTNVDREETLREHAARYDHGSVLQVLDHIRKTHKWLEQNANSRLAMETLLLQLPAAG